MKKKIIFISALVLVVFGIIYLKNDFKKTPPTLYFNANIITIDDKQPNADAMLVIDGIVESIGTLETIKHKHIKNLQKRDLNGATIMPGFIDPHTHFALSMFMAEMHDLSGFKHKNNKAVWNYYEEISKKATDNKWLIFKGLDPILVSDLVSPTIEYLDSVAPDNPIIIFSQSLHNYFANSKAFEKAGVSKSVKNPSKHSYYERDENGNFTGLIVEQEAVRPFLEKLQEEVLTAKMLSNVAQKVMTDYAKNGNTTIASTGLTISEKKSLLLTKHLSDKKPGLIGNFLAKIGQLPERQQNPRHFIYIRHDMPHLMPKKRGQANDFYDIIGIKHWYDGSPYIGTMYMEESYLTNKLTTNELKIPEGSKGKALVSKEDLKNFITDYHEQGWQIAIHTQGDAAITEVINAFDELDDQLDFNKSRHRLEHCLMLPTDELTRMDRLNLSPSFHINHLLYYGDALTGDMLGAQRGDAILPLNSTLKKGIISTLHADQPMFESKPFRLIQTAVERKTKSGKDLGSNEKIELLEAIKALTINAAWQIHMEDKIGSLAKGKYADFIILNQNPFEVATGKLDKIECVETFINGNSMIF